MVMQLFKVVETKAFTFSIEIVNKDVHLHVDCQEWAPSVLKDMYKHWAEFEDYCRQNHIGEVYSISPNRKFCELFGGEYQNVNVMTRDGIEHEVMKWDFKQ